VPDPVTELRTAAFALAAPPTPELHHHVGEWLGIAPDWEPLDRT